MDSGGLMQDGAACNRSVRCVYEMHIGTFTREGTWAAAMAELPALADLGVTVVEMMPVADFAGQFGWGYDGVDLYAPTRLYGRPDDLRGFVDRAHALGLGVILDVVYNHLGPDGNYLSDFSPDYFTDRYTNDWGRAINFEGPPEARAFFVENAGYWIDEYHFDGLRLDATQDIRDASPVHVLADITRRVRAAAGGRRAYVVAENEPQDTRLVRDPSRGGYGLDALWNDDYHHSAAVSLTGRREAYYTDYKGSVQEFISCAKYGYIYQGQWYRWQEKRRGTPGLDLPLHTFVAYIENHDQVANSAFGRRLHQISSPPRYRAITALTLLGPSTPMLFQGQEFASTSPFLYFADHREELQGPIRHRPPGVPHPVCQHVGSRRLQRAAVAGGPVHLRDDASWISRSATPTRARTLLHRDLLTVRRDTPAISQPAQSRRRGDCSRSVRHSILLGRRRLPAGRQPGLRPGSRHRRPNRCSRLRPAGDGRLSGAVRRCATAARARRRCTPTPSGTSPAKPRCCSIPFPGLQTTMASSLTRRDPEAARQGGGRSDAAPRMARHQRAWRLRIRHRRGRRDAALSRAARSRRCRRRSAAW